MPALSSNAASRIANLGGYAMYLLAVVCRYQAAPADLTPPDSFCSLLLVVGQPLNPLPPSGAVVVLVCLLQRIRVLLAVLVLVEVNRLTQRDIQQPHQLPGFGPASGARDEGFQSISPVLIATVRQRFKSRLPPSFAPCSFPTPLKAHRQTATRLPGQILADLIQRHQAVIVCGGFVPPAPAPCRTTSGAVNPGCHTGCWPRSPWWSYPRSTAHRSES